MKSPAQNNLKDELFTKDNSSKATMIKIVPHDAPALFPDSEMDRLLLTIPNPTEKSAYLLNKYTHRYKQIYYTLDQAAEYLNIKMKQLKALRDQGELDSKRVDGRICIYAGSIRKFLKKCENRQAK